MNNRVHALQHSLQDRKSGLIRISILVFFWIAVHFCCLQSVRAQNRIDPLTVRTRLNKILSQPEFMPEQPRDSLINRWLKNMGDAWNRFWKWLMETLQRMFGEGGQSGPSQGSGYNLQWILIAVFIIGGLILLAILLNQAISYWRSKKKEKSQGSLIFDLEDAASVLEPDEWLAHAKSFATQGDYRRALRALLLAIFLKLDRIDAIGYDRSRTNGEYIRFLRVRGMEPIALALTPMVLRFENHWYGNAVASMEDYRYSLEEYEKVNGLISSLFSVRKA